MEAENWHQVKEILEHAIEQSADEREHFIEEKCSGDVSLRGKIDSLISSYERIGDFMEDGPMGSVADMFAPNDEVQPGERLGRYEVVRVLGEGGMGKVYLADDPDLHRQVAIKVLRNDLWWYKQARQRLSREARAAARLDHPNICSIYEIEDSDDRSFIVMQYVEGHTLGDVMAKGGLGGRDSCRIALQIAGALEEAHSHHIIHRDIKPANIIINEKRQVKVLDFGLAKSIKPGSEENEMDLSSSGAVMGTVPYMSPEQLRGKTVDGRSDIFSLGALLYEMLSGRQAFGKDSNAETTAAILNDEPDLAIIPAKLRTVIGRSLEKKAGDRYQTISELASDLREIEIDTADDTAPQQTFSNWFGAKSVISTAYHRYFSSGTGRKRVSQRSYYKWQDSDADARTVRLTETVAPHQNTDHHPLAPGKRLLFPAAVAICALALAPALYFWLRTPKSDAHSFDSLRSVQLISWKDAASNVYSGYSSSHNGKMIAYSSKQDGPNEGIHIKQIADSSDVLVTKDQWKNYNPIWSPDDQQLAFISLRDGLYGIYTSPFLGGETTLVRAVDPGTISLRHWSNDGSAIYYDLNGNLFRLDITTRKVEQITAFTPIESPKRYFAFSPDESRIVYCDQVDGRTDLWIAPVKGGERTSLTNDPEEENHPVWHPDGERVIYSVTRDGRSQISVAYLDGRLPEQITRGEGEQQLIDLSKDGKSILYAAWEERSDVWRLKVENGQESPIVTGRESEFWPEVSPDGKSLVYQANSAANLGPLKDQPIFVVRTLLEIGAPKSYEGYDPRWLPDSRHVAFLRWQGPEKRDSLWVVDTVTGAEEQLTDERVRPPDVAQLPYNRLQTSDFSWSPDGAEVAYISISSKIQNVSRKTIGSSNSNSLTGNSEPSTKYYCPLYSPNGRHIAYTSVERPPTDSARSITRVWIAEGENTKEIFSTRDNLRLLGWDGEENLILESSDGLLKADPADVTVVQLSIKGVSRITARLKNIYAFSADLSLDGKTVAFTARENDRDDIFTVPSQGGMTKRISSNNDPRSYLGSLAWSPDGKNIIFDKQERIDTISMFENFR